MTVAVCPGSFDPVTMGHLHVFDRASRLFDEVVIAVLLNPSKRGLFAVEERVTMLEEAVRDLPGVTVETFDGLLVDFCAAKRAQAIVKGLRSGQDFDYELPMAQMNAHLTDVETVFVPAGAQWTFVSSSLVKEVARLGGDVEGLVPATVHARLLERLRD